MFAEAVMQAGNSAIAVDFAKNKAFIENMLCQGTANVADSRSERGKKGEELKAFYFYDYPAPAIGKLLLAEEDGALTLLVKAEPDELPPDGFCFQETELLKESDRQLREYFSGQRKEFTLPLRLQGTIFQRKVWQALCEIPFGQTVSYQMIAERIGSPKACRAVGQANHHNPISILVPCHRVIGKNGSLTGYGGGIQMKEYLLALEQSKTSV